MKFYQRFILLITLVASVAMAQNCPTTCLHDGTIDEKTCSCLCLPAWEGTYCEKAKSNCNAGQPLECGTSLSSDFCVFSKISSFCPKMCNHPACTCGIDTCLNGGFFDASTCSCKCPANFYGRVCENFSTCGTILTCQNFGNFNATSCRCECITPNFSGDRCENVACNVADPLYCSAYSKLSCTPNNFIYGICPMFCERCKITTTTSTSTTSTSTMILSTLTTTAGTSTTSKEATTLTTTQSKSTTQSTTTIVITLTLLSTTTGPSTTAIVIPLTTPTTTQTPVSTTTVITSCNPIVCENGFIFNTDTCSCPCANGFYGPRCESFNCAISPLPDLLIPQCGVLPCDISGVSGVCPFKCLCGGTTNPPTTTIRQTTTTPAPVTSCNPVLCENGFIFSTSTCSCPCSSGFSGARCELYNCATSPIPDALIPQCSLLSCDMEAVRGICPFKCLCGGSTTASVNG